MMMNKFCFVLDEYNKPDHASWWKVTKITLLCPAIYFVHTKTKGSFLHVSHLAVLQSYHAALAFSFGLSQWDFSGLCQWIFSISYRFQDERPMRAIFSNAYYGFFFICFWWRFIQIIPYEHCNKIMPVLTK